MAIVGTRPNPLLLMLFTGAAACGKGDSAEGQTRDAVAILADYPTIPQYASSVQFTPIPELTATYSPFEDPFTRVIRSAAEWTDHLRAFSGPDGPVPQASDVDFAAEQVFAVGIGYRASGGFSVSVEGVYLADGELFVAVLESRPGEGCMASMALTAPTTAVRTRAADGPVRFIQRAVSEPCPD